MSRRKKRTKSVPIKKYIYPPSALVYSPGWRIEDFRTADRQRELERDARKVANTETLRDLIALVDSEEICSFAVFMRYVYEHAPNLAVSAVQNHTIMRDFIRDKRFDVSCGFADMSYKDVCRLLKVEKQNNLDLESAVTELRAELLRIQDERQKWYEEYLKKCTALDESFTLVQKLLESNQRLSDMVGFEKIL